MNGQIVLDFDGVICDSAFEAFRIMLNAKGLTRGVFDDSLDHFYEDFLEFRKFVGPAWNYYFYEIGRGKKNTSLVGTDEALEFANEFFKVRRNVMSACLKNWLTLHKFYDKFIDGLAKQSLDLLFLTNKNADSVKMLLDFRGVPYSNVISMQHLNFDKKINYLNTLESSSIKFLDDHPQTILECVAERRSADIDCRWANWGYGAPQPSLFNYQLDQEGALHWIMST